MPSCQGNLQRRFGQLLLISVSIVALAPASHNQFRSRDMRVLETVLSQSEARGACFQKPQKATGEKRKSEGSLYLPSK